MKRRIISSSSTRNNSTQNASKFNPSLIGSNRSEIQVPSDFYSPRNFPFILKCKRYRRNPEGAVERESQQISRRKNGTCVRHWSRFKTSRPRKVPSGRMKNRRNLRGPSRGIHAKSSPSPSSIVDRCTAADENRITAYQFTILFAHRCGPLVSVRAKRPCVYVCFGYVSTK